MKAEKGTLSPFSLSRETGRKGGGLALSERRLLLLGGDLVVMCGALWLGLWLRREAIIAVFHKAGLPFAWKAHWWLVLSVLWVTVALTLGGYDLRRAAQALRSAVSMGGVALAVSAIYFVIPWISAPLVYSRLAWFIFATTGTVGVAAWRLVYAVMLHQPAFCRRILVVGAGRAGKELAHSIRMLGATAMVDIAGLVDDNPALWGKEIANYHVVGPAHQLERLAEELGANEIVVAITHVDRMRPELVQELVRCWSRGMKVVPMALFYEEVFGALPVEHVGHNLFALAQQEGLMSQRLWRAIRRLVDVVVAAAVLVVAVPLLPLVALAIWADSRGPIFYRQRRVGYRGEEFTLVKLRTMVPDAERGGAVWAREDDPRITQVGQWLRRTRLDEVPQMWNVLKGEMSLIGPRPERPEFVRELEATLPYYAIRHSVKPGLTGWAQVCYRYGSSLEDALVKLKYDLYYIKHQGPILDTAILLKTLRVMVTLKGR